MYIYLSSFLLFIELIFLSQIYKRTGFTHPIFILFTITFFYINSPIVDYFLFSIDHVIINSMDYILIFNNKTYFYVCLLYFTFTISLFIYFNINKNFFSDYHYFIFNNVNNNQNFKLNFRSNLFFIFSILSLLFFLSIIYDLERDIIKNIFSSRLYHIFLISGYSFLCFLIILLQIKNLFIFSFLILFSLVIKEREFLVIIFYIFLINYNFDKKVILISLISAISFLFIINFKVLFFYLYSFSNNLDVSFDLLFKQANTINIQRFTSSDPAAPLALLIIFLEDSSQTFNQYYLSYIINTWHQLMSFLGLYDWNSISTFTYDFYTNRTMGIGTPFLLEAILNFWYFGPFIIGFIISHLIKLVIKHSIKYNIFYQRIIYLFLFILIIKFVRTELAIILKLYFVPLFLSLFFYRKIFIK